MKDYKFSIFCILLIWVLCFMKVPEFEVMEDIPFVDKWTHIVMYAGTCGVIWIEYLRRHRTERNGKRLLMFAIVAPIIMSGIIEILQENCTGGNRGGDWLDFAANTLGVLLAAAIGHFLFRKWIH